MKDKFFYEGLPSKQEEFGSCMECPFVRLLSNKWICNETEEEVSWNVKHGKMNGNCPFISK